MINFLAQSWLIFYATTVCFLVEYLATHSRTFGANAPSPGVEPHTKARSLQTKVRLTHTKARSLQTQVRMTHTKARSLQTKVRMTHTKARSLQTKVRLLHTKSRSLQITDHKRRFVCSIRSLVRSNLQTANEGSSDPHEGSFAPNDRPQTKVHLTHTKARSFQTIDHIRRFVCSTRRFVRFILRFGRSKRKQHQQTEPNKEATPKTPNNTTTKTTNFKPTLGNNPPKQQQTTRPHQRHTQQQNNNTDAKQEQPRNNHNKRAPPSKILFLIVSFAPPPSWVTFVFGFRPWGLISLQPHTRGKTDASDRAESTPKPNNNTTIFTHVLL
jgi:hypothetical protein